jgi:hypothetical protein
VTSGQRAAIVAAPLVLVTMLAVYRLLASLPLLPGLCLGWVAHRPGSIRWTVVSHVLAGAAMA